MDENKIIKYESGSLVKHVGIAISASNKLLTLSEKKKVLDFYVSHPDLFKKHISSFYSLNISHLRKYKNLLDWSFAGISWNKSIRWTEEIMDEFDDKLSWSTLTANQGIAWEIALIKKYKMRFDKISWSNLSSNSSILFTESLIDEFCDQWDWGNICGNKNISWTGDLIKRYKARVNWNKLSENPSILFSESTIDKYKTLWNWVLLSANISFPWNDNYYFEKYKSELSLDGLVRNTSFHWSPDIIESFDLDSENWSELSNWIQIWDEKSINKFQFKIDFSALSYNDNIKWTEDMVDSYLDRLNWGALSSNYALPFTVYFIEKYFANWIWKILTTNEGLPWSVDFIDHFKDKWNWDLLGRKSSRIFLNNSMWEKAFHSFVDDQMIEEVMEKTI